MQVLKSGIDRSINMIRDAKVGYWETRYVDRGAYQVVYLSSQSGCNHGCRFCHLTSTRQTSYMDADRQELLDQAWYGLERCQEPEPSIGRTNVIHYNFMARGEPLANVMLDDETLWQMGNKAIEHGFLPRFIISTIIPRGFIGKISDRFSSIYPDIYYSLYSTDEGFRKRWMPNAAPYQHGLYLLREWQKFSRKIPKIHFAPIPGACDSAESIDAVCRAIQESGVRVDFNLVMYNPPAGMAVTESIRPMEEIADQISSAMPWSKVDIIRRVGEDVYASCGMFFSGKE